MRKNKEVAFIKALRPILTDLSIEYSDGRNEKFVDVVVGDYPENAAGYPVLAIVPMGPQFLTQKLGAQTLGRKLRFVGVTLEIHYEHHDKELGIFDMSDILWNVVDAILAHPRLGGAESIEIGEVDYAYTTDDTDEGGNKIADWGYKGAALIPVYAEYRYS